MKQLSQSLRSIKKLPMRRAVILATVFVSRKDNVVVMKLSASKLGAVSAKFGLLPTALKREELGDGKNVRVPRFTQEYEAKVVLPEVPITFNPATEDDHVLTLVAIAT